MKSLSELPELNSTLLTELENSDDIKVNLPLSDVSGVDEIHADVGAIMNNQDDLKP